MERGTANKGGNAVIRPLYVYACEGRFFDYGGNWGNNYMIRLRPYKPSDGWKVIDWWDGADEETFIKWSCGKFMYPLTMEQMDSYFSRWCLQDDSGWLMTALDENGMPVGHFIMRLADYEKNAVRLGFIVVDPAARGKGYGKKMIKKALQYAFEVLGMESVSLGVFENNPQAKACYEAAGFTAKAYVPEYHAENGVTYAAYEMEAVRHEENK